MHLIIGFLSLLIAAPSFEGKWTAEIQGPPGSGMVNMLCEIKADGTAEISATDKDGKVVEKLPGKWKKTGEKTIEIITAKDPKRPDKPATAELIEENTLELTDPDNQKKLKMKRV